MIRPLFAVLGALALLVVWLGLVMVQAKGSPASFAQALGDSAYRSHLPGLAAHAYLLSAQMQRRHLYNSGVARDSASGQSLIRQIIATRMAAARLLLQSGYVAAAERIALEGARADFDDLQARALLLEVRLRGHERGNARRELMLLLLKQEDPQLLYLLGSSFAREGAADDAVACFERALKVHPEHVASLVALADLREKQGQAELAAELLQRAGAAARTTTERELVAAAFPSSASATSATMKALLVWLSAHFVSLLLAGLYLLFLLSPAILSSLKIQSQCATNPS